MSDRAAEAPERTVQRYALDVQPPSNPVRGYITGMVEHPTGPYVRASDFDRLREQAEGLRTERDALRAAMEGILPADEGFTEAFDALLEMGLLTEVPADDEFRAEYDAETMFVWTWVAARYRGGDDGK